MNPASNNTNPIQLQNVFFNFLVLILSLILISFTSMADNPHLSTKRNQSDMLRHGVQQSNKKLKRLPHVFNRVLELPLKSDANVLIENDSNFFRFVADVGESVSFCGEGMRVGVSVVRMYPNVMKVVVNGDRIDGDDDDDDELGKEGLEMDKWRFRLPDKTRLERTTAVCVEGELVVIVPKDSDEVDENGIEMEKWNGIESIDSLVEVV